MLFPAFPLFPLFALFALAIFHSLPTSDPVRNNALALGKFNEFPSRVCSSNIISFRPFLLSKAQVFPALSTFLFLPLSTSLHHPLFLSYYSYFLIYYVFSSKKNIETISFCAWEEAGRDGRREGRYVASSRVEYPLELCMCSLSSSSRLTLLDA